VRFVGEVSTRADGDCAITGPLEGHQLEAAVRTERPAIAVLPFINAGGEPEQDYFADGIAEDIITELSRQRWFLVIARNSSFAYKGRSAPLKEIGAELGVSYVVEGSVRRSGEHVRITAQLNEVATGQQLWAERYDRRLSDVFAIQDEIAESIVAAIEPQVHAAESFRAQRSRRTASTPGTWSCGRCRTTGASHRRTIAGHASCSSRRSPSTRIMPRRWPCSR